MKLDDINKGMRVRWEDPDGGICSAEGTVFGVYDDGTVIVQKEDGTEIEALASELVKIGKKDK